MKTLFSAIILSSLFLSVVACKEPTIDEGILPLVSAATVDADGGAWRTIVLKSATDINVPQPAATTSDTYQRELTGIKNGLLSINPEQNTAVTYWADGGVRRWNQIARQLVAKYNLLPNYLTPTSGTLSSTDPANPMASPTFAARVYALLSVAQYDALVVAWRAKYQYNRPSLETQGVISRVPVLNVPSYPSEDAAIAEASYQLLAYVFPNETAWLKTKAAEHKQSRLWAGACVPSDVKAGEDLAATVAATVIDRAKNDRFSAAHDPNNTWQTGLAKSTYDVRWTSLENPVLAPMLPLGGRVRTWYDSTAVLQAKPSLPPATTSAEFQKALGEVRDMANTRTREQWRIASYWDDGIATYGLSGHWNFLAEGLIRDARQNELRSARTYALLNRAMQDGATASWSAIYTYFVPRPSQMDASIKTATTIPNYPTYVSDHATIASAASTVLAYIFPDQATQLNAQGIEAGISRLYSGVNYRFDIEAGANWGNRIGQLAVDGAKTDGAK
ncbi:phosphatase PAP2 family protein [Spirosoma validum]|uniref:Phosphatase PAP2 family protein n=1 Tax=Spirosoma validum TaxID=2771355 RepID=A0A927GBA8_9BACT|nr:phosphatase PAP2 family protein [Spirosoma validum]MBD2751404.1 phosphatase PAP2 family protein [Spirosoma validum]